MTPTADAPLCPVWAANPISRLRWNGGFGAISYHSRRLDERIKPRTVTFRAILSRSERRRKAIGMITKPALFRQARFNQPRRQLAHEFRTHERQEPHGRANTEVRLELKQTSGDRLRLLLLAAQCQRRRVLGGEPAKSRIGVRALAKFTAASSCRSALTHPSAFA